MQNSIYLHKRIGTISAMEQNSTNAQYRDEPDSPQFFDSFEGGRFWRALNNHRRCCIIGRPYDALVMT